VELAKVSAQSYVALCRYSALVYLIRHSIHLLCIIMFQVLVFYPVDVYLFVVTYVASCVSMILRQVYSFSQTTERVRWKEELIFTLVFLDVED